MEMIWKMGFETSNYQKVYFLKSNASNDFCNFQFLQEELIKISWRQT